ncbi:unnamed protein product, partial [Arabidopsis halleri]
FSGEEHDSEREQRMKMLEDESDPSDPDFEIPNEDGYDNDSSSSDSVSDEDGDEELINKFQLEIEDDKKKRTMHCKKCGQPGHNTRSCAKRAKRGHGEPSSSQSTQPMSQMDQA